MEQTQNPAEVYMDAEPGDCPLVVETQYGRAYRVWIGQHPGDGDMQYLCELPSEVVLNDKEVDPTTGERPDDHEYEPVPSRFIFTSTLVGVALTIGAIDAREDDASTFIGTNGQYTAFF